MVRKGEKPKKNRLKKETVRTLTNNELKEIAGGAAKGGMTSLPGYPTCSNQATCNCGETLSCKCS